MNMAGQESFTLYKKADIEGYLDKTNTGITARWLSGKSRTWCELYGTMLYMFKDNKDLAKIRNRSSGGSQQVDMTQVHMVRKTTTDKSGLQFEILCKNKQHTFCASSVDECDNWIRRLQAAMTLKDQDSPSAQTRTVTVGDYETIAVLPEDEPSTPCIRIGASSTADPGYSEVEFQKPPTSPQGKGAASAGARQSAEAEGDSGYATVEFQAGPGAEQPVIEPVQTSRGSGLPSSSQPPPDKPVIEEDGYGYATVEMRKKSITELPQPRGSAARTAAESKDGDSYVYAKVQRKPASGTDVGKSEESASIPADGMSEGSSDDDDVLISTAQRNPDPIPPFPHPLQPEDLEPLVALQEFLSSNRKLCRPSFSDRTWTENPVDDMKRLLEELRL